MDKSWDEKNLIEQQNSCENKKELETNDITNETNKTSCEKECKDTGPKWTKRCPECNKIQIYKTRHSYWNAKNRTTICTSCKNSGCNNPFYKKHHTDVHKKKLSDIQKKDGSYRYKNLGGNPKKMKKVCKKCGIDYFVIKSRQSSMYCNYKCALIDNFGFGDNKMTSPEVKVAAYLKDNNIEYKYNYELHGKLYDFYIPKTNTLIEVDGIYWHGKNKKIEELNSTQIKNKKNDEIKIRLAIENGYNLVRIWEDEVKNVSKYLC